MEGDGDAKYGHKVWCLATGCGLCPWVDIVSAGLDFETDAISETRKEMRSSSGAFESSIVVAKDLI